MAGRKARRGAGLASRYRAGTRTYTTAFPGTENPISESGNWINGAAVGLDWGNVGITPGKALGYAPIGVAFADATALITGVWGNNQTVYATVYTGAGLQRWPEVEVRLRSSLSAHVNNGYEITWAVSPNDTYCYIVRWNGPKANYTILASNTTGGGVVTGDVVKGIVVGSVITAYKNDVQVLQATDSTYGSGLPGMGFNEENAGDNGIYGFSSLTATDGP